MDGTTNNQKQPLFRRIGAFFGKHRHVTLILIALISAFVIEFFASISTSPLYPAAYAYNDTSIDPNFFMYAGSLILQGKTPYIDFFDHKGLYVFLIDALGLSFGIGKFGVFIVQVVSYAIALDLLYEAMDELGYGNRGVLTATLLFFIGSVACFGGNHTGEWLLPYCSLIIFFAAKAIRRGEEKYWFLAVFAGGIQAGFSFNSRPSDAMWGLAVCIAYFIHYLRVKPKRINILYAVGLALLGLALPFAVSVPMSIAGGYTDIMFKAVILQNIVYVSGHEQPLRWLYHLLVALYMAAAIAMSVYRFRHSKERDLQAFLLCNLLIGGTVNLVIARYTHYYISAFPAIALEIISFFELLKGKKLDFQARAPRHIFDGTLAFGGAFLGVLLAVMNYTVGWFDTSVSMEKAIEASIVHTIPKEDMERVDGVYCLDTNVSIYLNNNLKVSTNYYTFQTWWALDNKDVGTAVLDYLKTKAPAWVIQGDIGANELEYEESKLGYEVVAYVKAHYEVPEAFDPNTPRITIWRLKA